MALSWPSLCLQKKFGVRTGEPVTDALKKCPSLVSVAPDHELYARYSHSMIELLKKYSPTVLKYSIDECFMEYSPVEGDEGDPVKAAHIIKDVIRDTLGFTVNIGVSTNRLLAKMASDFKKPDLVHTLFPEEIQVKMWPASHRRLVYGRQLPPHTAFNCLV